MEVLGRSALDPPFLDFFSFSFSFSFSFRSLDARDRSRSLPEGVESLVGVLPSGVSFDARVGVLSLLAASSCPSLLTLGLNRCSGVRCEVCSELCSASELERAICRSEEDVERAESSVADVVSFSEGEAFPLNSVPTVAAGGWISRATRSLMSSHWGVSAHN